MRVRCVSIEESLTASAFREHERCMWDCCCCLSRADIVSRMCALFIITSEELVWFARFARSRTLQQEVVTWL